MLQELHIRGLGVIDDATVPLGPGLTVLTGETGAGKTMVVSALLLLLGARAERGLVRSGAAAAAVDGRLLADADSVVSERAQEAGAIRDDDGALIVSRTMSAEGRSRGFLGGRPVPVGLLADLAAELVCVHGQSDQLRLMRPAEQRAALDRYAGPEHLRRLADFQDIYRGWRACAEDLDDRLHRSRERRQEADMLRHALAEIEAVAPQPGEDVTVAAEVRRLAGADELRAAASAAHDALTSDATRTDRDQADIAGLLGVVRSALGQVEDPALRELADRAAEVATLVTDLTADLADYLEGLDADPTRLAGLEERRALLRGLTRKYAEDVDGVIAWQRAAEARLAALDTSDEELGRLRAERDRMAADVATRAGALTASRRKAARRFGAAVTAELAGLAMPDARLEVRIAPHGDGVGSDPAIGPDGADDVTLLLAAHAGAPARPVHRGASGGELSRVMLAIEVIFAAADPVPTMIFDEVDAGVGGTAATEVGRRLARLARDHQVVVVTHLPQVAAYADAHVVVDKHPPRGGSRATTTSVQVLDAAGRVRELARMLAGLPESDSGRVHAEELLSLASAERSATGEDSDRPVA